MRKKLSREEYNLLLSLVVDNYWLRDKKDVLLNLFDECKDADEVFLVCDLLSKFCFLNTDEYKSKITDIADEIVKEFEGISSQTQISAFTGDRYADSGQVVVQTIKHILIDKGWSGGQPLNRYEKTIDKIDIKPNIVLVDEFIGSGKTALNRAKAIVDRAKQKSPTITPNIKFFVIACMEDAKQLIENAGYEIFSAINLKKGISGYLNDFDLIKAEINMLILEGNLKHKINKIFIPSFGYGSAEALFSWELGNIPNSVFPVFWWPKYKSNKNRIPLFRRSENGLEV